MISWWQNAENFRFSFINALTDHLWNAFKLTVYAQCFIDNFQINYENKTEPFPPKNVYFANWTSGVHLASRSAVVLALLTTSPSLCLHRENRREPMTQVIGNSTEGSRSKSNVIMCLCSAHGWNPRGRPMLAVQVNNACSKVSGYLAGGAPQSRQSGVW